MRFMVACVRWEFSQTYGVLGTKVSGFSLFRFFFVKTNNVVSAVVRWTWRNRHSATSIPRPVYYYVYCCALFRIVQQPFQRVLCSPNPLRIVHPFSAEDRSRCVTRHLHMSWRHLSAGKQHLSPQNRYRWKKGFCIVRLYLCMYMC